MRTIAVQLLAAPDALQWALTASSESEADLRARAVALLRDSDDRDATRTLLQLARDVDLGVRSAAIDALSERHDSVRVLLDGAALKPHERIAAYTLLRLAGEVDAGRSETDARAVRHLALLDGVLGGIGPAVVEPLQRSTPPRGNRREIGHTGLVVHPFGVSGAHDLSFEDLEIAHARGVDLFFWEPSHRELRRFLRARRDAVVVTGTYHADARSIEQDVVRALRALRRDHIDVFLAFWARSPARIDHVTDVLRELVARGIVRAVGLSTHDRTLACEAADRGMDVVMVRHSAAHRGVESSVLPHCASRGTGVLTFSNLCYGRMLRRTPAPLSVPITAADCYRYSLSQPGVHACVAAPRRRSELLEDLAVVDAPALDAARQDELRQHGDHVYAMSKAWTAETWSVAERRSCDSVVKLSRDAPRASHPPAMFRRG